LTRKEFIENSADAPGLARSSGNLQNLRVIASTKRFLWQNGSILTYSHKGFSTLTQIVILKDNANLKMQSKKLKLKIMKKFKIYRFKL
jgi:hypothetical protein